MLTESIQAVTAHIKRTGPWDGLCGFSQGGEVLSVMARMAEEGEPDLQGQFKFLICFGHLWPKEEGWRPRCALRVPACHIFERNGHYPPSDFEHLALYWHPAFREVIPHDQGHKPPRLKDVDLARLRRFLEAFHQGIAWAAAPDPTNLRGLCLPMPRRRPAVLSRPTPSRRLPVLCLHDVAPGRCEPSIFDRLMALVREDPDLSSMLELERPALERFADLDGLVDPAPICPRFMVGHVVSDAGVATAARIAVDVLVGSALGTRPVVVVGVGVGAYFGLQLAHALKGRGGFPWRLYAVQPPVVFPVGRPGELGGCDITCLLPLDDTGGERWRLEVATRGPYRVELFNAAVDPDAWADAVVQSLRAALAGAA